MVVVVVFVKVVFGLVCWCVVGYELVDGVVVGVVVVVVGVLGVVVGVDLYVDGGF